MVGQQAVVRTLVNAIQMNRTHQAYVFSGSRGIGKTSIARIFSKALRCPRVELRDGILHSCDQCSDCIEIAAGTSVDVLEIDGASNNGVDNIREIRESAKFLPSSGQYRIFIVDEVHMLTTQAFNALLKTLEEPPPHVVFIFATTEPHKIPETILGRCQRFDFKRVTVAQITGRLKEVLSAEQIEAEEAALGLIARSAEGSMRDALSILDQVISFSGAHITTTAVRESIGLIGTELVFQLLRGIVKRDAKTALGIAQDAFHQGVDLKLLLKSLIEMTHALILMQAGIERPETQFTPDELEQLRGLLPDRQIEENELIFQVFHHGLDLVARAAQPKLIFDLLIVKTTLADAIVPVDPNRPADPSRPPQGGGPSSGSRRDPALAEMFSKVSAAASAGTANASAANPAPVHPAPPPEAGLGFSFRSEKRDPSPALPPKTEAPRALAQGASWEGLLELCSRTKPVLAILLESVVEWELPKTPADRFRIGFRESDRAKSEQVNMKATRDQFAQLTEGYFGFRAIPESFVSSRNEESVAERNARLHREGREAKMRSILGHEIVQEARSLFGADLVEIRMTGQGA